MSKPHLIIDGKEHKWCSGHQRYEPLSGFNRNKRSPDGYSYNCRECMHQRQKKWRESKEGREKKRAATKRYKRGKAWKESLKRYKKGEAGKASMARYRKSDAGKAAVSRLCRTEKHKERVRSFNKTPRGRELVRQRVLKKYYSDRLSMNMSGGMRRSLISKGRRHWEDLVPYTADDLKKHLESLFQPGMSWENYGKFGWHIDHIIPKSFFQFTSTEDVEFKYCWSLDNLQPLWWRDNIVKSNNI